MIVNQSITNRINKLGRLQSWQQRGILGATAIVTQPVIDLKNKDIDSETKKYAAIRTATKIIIGTSIGVLTRFLGAMAGARLANKNIIKPITEKMFENPEKLQEFASGVGNVLAVLATIVTTITVDIPLTNKTLNVILKKVHIKVESKKNTGNTK